MDHLDWEITRRRLAGVTDAGVTPVAIFETPASLVEHGRTAGIALLSRPDRPTAIACQSDLLASGVVLAARELGLRVPQDVSVSGFDGLDLPWLAPDVLTTVVQPLAEKGAAIGHAVEDFLAGDGTVAARAARDPADRVDDGTGARPPQLSRTTAWALPSTRTPSTDTVRSMRAVPASGSSAPTTATTSTVAAPGSGTGTGRVKRTW